MGEMVKIKISIRKEVFETNSSNTCVLTLFSKKDWRKYCNCELLRWKGDFVDREDAIIIMNNNIRKTLENEDREDTEKLWEEYNKIDQESYNELISFINNHGYYFGSMPKDRNEYYEDYSDYLDYEEYKQKVNGETVIAECFFGYNG